MSSISTGIAMKLGAALSSTLMLACVKALNGTIPVGEVIFFRSAIALLPLLGWLSMSGGIVGGIRTRNVSGHMLRGLAGTGGMYLSYLSLLYISLSDATLINYSAPLFTVVMAALFLREEVIFHRWVAVVAGFSGILVMLSGYLSFTPSSFTSINVIGICLALLAALCTAGASIQIRFLNRNENPGAIAFWFAVMTALTSMFTLIFGWKIPDSSQLLLLLGCGLFGGVTQILLTLSLRHADASLLAPFDYTTLIWSIIIVFITLGTLPGSATLTGALLIVTGGCYSFFIEHNRRRRFLVNRG
ncbi:MULTISPECIES: DMT family transporter [unclassified Pantoea]|uniref:DMT family transporter n=1 Tax=unclassified Pantoea TaxID=2630326 RepID=UPI001CD68DFF|nr:MULTISPECIES: DMT family transporter [unclassified Pantoea]MCA1179814.1 DMT family transporter [Pantoea sp. alder69]MCA1253584.1 DMT family transporter [Pantoea sp. alder70]MCA1268300.1 DMT family transporter [Pantoea sp. alder81]